MRCGAFSKPGRARLLARQAGLSQAKLAKAAGTTQPHIADIESGKHGASFDLMARIAKALRVKIDDLTPGE
jgi:transcriptional regulator with XRE-family HTH domain